LPADSKTENNALACRRMVIATESPFGPRTNSPHLPDLAHPLQNP